MSTQEYGAVIKWAISQVPDVRKAYVFGSRVSGKFRIKSDLDILVESDVELARNKRREIKRESYKLFGIAADLIVVTDAEEFIERLKITALSRLELR